MNKENAIRYLQRKGKISDDKHPEFDEDEKEKIEKVMRGGKIYGDPVAKIDF